MIKGLIERNCKVENIDQVENEAGRTKDISQYISNIDREQFSEKNLY
jgi:cation transport regulator ChaC